MKNIFFTILGISAILPVMTFGQQSGGNINTLDQFTSTTSPQSAITQRIFGKSLYLSGLNLTGSVRCLQISATGIVEVASAACGSGGGGGGSGGTWSTTTSSVANQLINYPNNATDIPCIGGTATSSCEYYFDPNTRSAVLTGTTTASTTRIYTYVDPNNERFLPLNTIIGERGFSRFTQYNATVATTSFHTPTNYYLATSTTNLSSVTATNNSGATYNPVNNSWLIINNSNVIYEHDMDGKLIRTINLVNFTDTEALSWMYDDWFVIGDEQGGRITWLHIPNATTSINRLVGNTISTAGTFGTGNSTIEGVAYDDDRDVFYISIEGGGNSMGIYTVTRAGVITPTVSTSTWAAANIGDASDLYYDRNTQHFFVAVDQCNGQSNGTGSTACDGVFEVDLATGAIVDKIHAPVGFTQVEGIGFTPDGRRMLITGEGDMWAMYNHQDRAQPFTFYQSASTTPVHLGIGTTSPYAPLSVVGQLVASYYTATSTTATSTYAAGIQATYLSLTGTTATSTAANGLNLSSGCYAINGVCIGAGSISGSGTSGQVTFWNGTNSITGDTGFTYNSGTDALTVNGQLSADNYLNANTSIILRNDGSADFANGLATVQTDGQINAPNANISTKLTTSIASTTYFSSEYASSTRWFGGGLTDCKADNQTVSYDITTGQFGCGDDDSSAGGGTFPFTPITGGNATTTTLIFQDGFVSTASSTINAPLRLTGLSGLLYAGTSGTVDDVATGTLSCSGSVACTSRQVIGGDTTIGLTNPINVGISLNGNANFIDGANSLGTPGQVLITTGTSVRWSASTTFSGGLTYLNGNVTSDLGTSIDLGSEVTGTLPINRGGTNATSYPTNVLMFYDGTSFVATGTPQLTVGNINATSTATSTFVGGVSANRLNATATSTLNGLRISTGGLTISSLGSGLLKTDASGNVNIGIAGTDYTGIITLTAGAGLTGGGDTSTNRTFDVGAGTGITVNANDVAINYATPGTWTGLHQFQAGASTTILSAYNALYVGTTATTTILGTATSTFGAGIQTSYINQTGTAATSTFANGINMTGGCYAINGVCIGGGSGAVSSVTAANTSLTISPTTGAVQASLNTANANTWTALQQFSNSSSTLASVYNALYVGTTATTTISGTATSTFGAGIEAPYLNMTGTTATNTFSNGLQIKNGGIMLDRLLNCNGANVVETDAAGNLTCGTDSTGGTPTGVANSIAYFDAAGNLNSTSSHPLYVGAVVGTSTTINSNFNSKVGISSSSPWAQLSVNPVAGQAGAQFAVGSSTKTNFVVGNNGFVGAGTTTPVMTIEAVTPSLYASPALGSVNGSSWAYFHAAGNNALIWNGTSAFRFGGETGYGTGFVEAMRITGDRRVVVGNASTSPWAQLAINPEAGVAANQFVIGSSTATNFLVTNRGFTGVATTAPSGRFSINPLAGDLVAFNIGSTTKELLSVSTEGFGTTTLAGLSVVGTATSTSNVGINLSGGCFAIAGTCVGSGSGSGTVNSGIAGQLGWYASSGTAISGTSTWPLTVGSIIATTTATSTFQGPITVGSSTPALFNALLALTGYQNSYVQSVIQNKSAGNNASANFIAMNDKGTDSSYYTELGINGSGYVQAGFNSQNASDGYLLSSDGGLVIGTASSTNTLADLRFITGGTASSSIRMVITPTGNVGIGTTSPYAKLSVVGEVVAAKFTATSTASNATSTFFGPVSHVATTTFSSNVGFTYASTTQNTLQTIDWSTGSSQRVVLGANTIFVINATSSKPLDGGRYILKACQGAAGGFTGTFVPTHIRWPTDSGTTTIRTTANTCTHIWLTWDSLYNRYSVLGSTTVSIQ